MYNNPRNVARLAKESGSLVTYTTNDTEIIDISPSADLSAVDIIPRKTGTATVCIIDLWFLSVYILDLCRWKSEIDV